MKINQKEKKWTYYPKKVTNNASVEFSILIINNLD